MGAGVHCRTADSWRVQIRWATTAAYVSLWISGWTCTSMSIRGVFVVDAKRYRNARPALRVEGGLLRPRVEFLTVGGRDRTALVTGMQKQVALVREALADLPEVPVQGVLCFVDADWPLIGAAFTVNDVAVMSPKKLKALLSQPGPLNEGQIADAQWRLHEAFLRQKPATSTR